MSLSLIRLYLVSVLLCLLAISAANATPDPQFRFDSWTTDNGLPQASINSILQTSDGFLWLSTFGGLVRYDGLRFQVFNTGNTPGLKSSRFNQLLEDKGGSLWIVTEGQGVTRYKDGEFRTFTTEDGLPRNLVDTIREAADGSLTFIFGKDSLIWKDGKFVAAPVSVVDLPSQNILDRSPDGDIWYKNGTHLLKYHNDQLMLDVDLGFTARRAVEDSSGRTWISSDDHLFLLKDGILTPMSGPWASGFMALSEDNDKNIWFCLRGGDAGLILFKDGRFTRFSTADGLINNNVQVMYQDREGTMWIGTAGGLSRMTQQVVTAYSADNGLAANNVYPILEDHAGKIWIGSSPGLTTFENGKFQNVGAQYLVGNEWVTSLFEDIDGTLWIGTWGGGVKQVRNGKTTIFSPEEIGGSQIRAILRDRAGDLWFGTAAGLIRWRDGVFTKFTTANGLAENIITSIFQDSTGPMWIGTSLGVTLYENGQFRPPAGIDRNNVRSFYEDSNGTVWIGMYDSGLYRYKNGAFTAFTVKDGLFDNGVFRIVEDGAGNFWITCNLGIYRVKKEELNDFAEARTTKVSSIPYNRRDGMLNSECNGGGQPAGVRTRDGKIWFPTQKGVVIVTPEAVPLNAQPPPVVIESVYVDTKPVPLRPKIEINPNQTYLELHYSGLSFINPELVKFKFKLEGLDDDWVDAGTRRTAYYPHLPPGDYRFVVLAANRDGVWNEQGASVAISVLPPFWRTWWFSALAAIAVLLLVYFAYRYRIGRLEQAHSTREAFARQLIESQENERKRIAGELHDSLGQSLVLIKNWALLGSKAIDPGNPAKTNLDEISDTASEAIKEVREIAYNLGPYQLERLGLRKTVEEMVQKVADSSPIRFKSQIGEIDGFLDRESEISFFRIVQEAINNVVKHSGAANANIKIDIDKNAVTLAVRDDGVGFDTENGKRGFGLLGMSERVGFLRGELKVISSENAGTYITATMPCNGKTF